MTNLFSVTGLTAGAMLFISTSCSTQEERVAKPAATPAASSTKAPAKTEVETKTEEKAEAKKAEAKTASEKAKATLVLSTPKRTI